MLVSVIIPNYNHSLYLRQRIESVLNQTFQNFEVIILDDCSTDNSREIIEQYRANPRVSHIIFNEQNSGSTFKQWNKGMVMAQGKYIWIAESDDYADPQFLQILITKLEEDSSIGLAYCDSWHIYEEKGTTERNFELYTELHPTLWKNDFTVDGIELIKKYMAYLNFIPNASAVLLRRDAVNIVAPPNGEMKLIGDWIYWASILAISKVSFVAEPLNYFRHHRSTVRNNSKTNGIYITEVSQMLVIMNQYGKPEDFFFNKMTDTFLDSWFWSMTCHDIPLEKHIIIFKNLNQVVKDFKKIFFIKCNQYLIKKTLAVFRKILGDKLLFPFIKRLTK